MAASGSGGGSGAGGGQIKAGKAAVELGIEDKGFKAGLDRAAKRLAGFGKSLLKIGAGVGGLGSAGLAGFATTLGRLEELKNLDGVAKAFGLTSEAATGLFGVMAAAGSDTRDATEGLVTLGQRVKDALSGTGKEAAELFQGLGIGAEKFAGLDPSEQFFQLHAALRQVQDPATRVQLLLKAVGEDTGKNLIQTLSLTTDELRAQAKGFALSGDEMAKASKASQAVATANAKLDKVWSKLVIAIAPVVESMANKVGPIFESVGNIISKNSDTIEAVASVAAVVAPALVAAGGGLMAFGAIATGVSAGLAALSTAIGVIGTVAGFLVTPFGIATAAIAGFTALVGAATASVVADTGAFDSIAGTAKKAWGGIVGAFKKGDLRLAWQIALAGVELEWSKFVLWLTKGWVGFKSLFVDSFDDAIAALKVAFWDFAAFMTRTFSFALRPIIKAAASVTDAIGMDEMAANLRALDLSDENVNRNRDNIQRGIMADRQRAQAENDAFRAQQIGGAQRDVAMAMRNLGKLVEQAAEIDPEKDWSVRSSPGPQAQPFKPADATRGTFSGYGGPRFFGGAATVAEKQLKVAEKGVELQAEGNKILEGIERAAQRQEQLRFR